MNVPTKLAVFLGALLVVFGGAAGIGSAVGPVGSAPAADHDEPAAGHGDAASGHGDEEAGSGDDAGTEASGPAAALPKGLMVSQDGYTFRLGKTTVAPGTAVPVSFTIEGPDGRPVTDFDVEHEKRLHLIAVRRDFSGFQHVHPTVDAEGTWTGELDFTPGQWRVFADFKPTAGEALTLGSDVAVRGAYRPAAPPADTRTSTVDGYEVTLGGDLTAGQEAKLTLSVERDGEPVTDLQPYLGAYGHLVALRGGDLAYLHVHPEGTPGDGSTEPGPDIVFFTEVPSPGRYHVYLDFKHEGVVRTAAFTVTVSGDGTSAPQPADDSDDSEESEDSDGHSGDSH
jgi:hypothetical protein